MIDKVLAAVEIWYDLRMCSYFRNNETNLDDEYGDVNARGILNSGVGPPCYASAGVVLQSAVAGCCNVASTQSPVEKASTMYSRETCHAQLKIENVAVPIKKLLPLMKRCEEHMAYGADIPSMRHPQACVSAKKTTVLVIQVRENVPQTWRLTRPPCTRLGCCYRAYYV
jgi:hypothetical protein